MVMRQCLCACLTCVVVSIHRRINDYESLGVSFHGMLPYLFLYNPPQVKASLCVCLQFLVSQYFKLEQCQLEETPSARIEAIKACNMYVCFEATNCKLKLVHFYFDRLFKNSQLQLDQPHMEEYVKLTDKQKRIEVCSLVISSHVTVRW